MFLVEDGTVKLSGRDHTFYQKRTTIFLQGESDCSQPDTQKTDDGEVRNDFLDDRKESAFYETMFLKPFSLELRRKPVLPRGASCHRSMAPSGLKALQFRIVELALRDDDAVRSYQAISCSNVRGVFFRSRVFLVLSCPSVNPSFVVSHLFSWQVLMMSPMWPISLMPGTSSNYGSPDGSGPDLDGMGSRSFEIRFKDLRDMLFFSRVDSQILKPRQDHQ